jgi:hypothetical protein
MIRSFLRGMRRRNRIQHAILLVLTLLLAVLAMLLPEHQSPLNHHENLASTVQHKPQGLLLSKSRTQKIVILPGPHKTGTTSVQAALFRWMHTTTNDGDFTTKSHNTSLFGDWAYPVPTVKEFESSIQSYSYANNLVGGKGFSPMITRLFANPSKSPEESILSSPLLLLYRQKIQQAWDQGYNLVIASEHLDRLVLMADDDEPVLSSSKNTLRRVSPDQLWERFLHLLPPSARTTENMIIGIQHRTPRMDHLISLWHHLGKQQESLLDYMTKPTKPGLRSAAYSLNSLGLADFFVQRGHVVRILDTGSPSLLLEQRTMMDLPIAVACHVLQISTNISHCIESLGNNNTTTSSSGTSKHLNQRSDPGERKVDTHTLQAINRLLMDYDCQFYHDFFVAPQTRNKKVEWIDGGKVVSATSVFASNNCSSANKRSRNIQRPLLFSETIQAIVDLVCRQTYYPITAKHCRNKQTYK